MATRSQRATRLICQGIYQALVFIWFFAAVCAIAKPAYAYVDPGSGLFLLQVLSSTFVGFSFLIRKRIRQVLGRFGAKPKETESGSEPS